MNIVKNGTEEQKEHYLPKFLNGEVRFSISITEPDAGSDASNTRTRAIKNGNQYIINGQKVFASAAHTKNNVIAMLTRTDNSKSKHEGLTVFLVPNDTPGLELKLLPTLARHATGTNEIFLTDVKISEKDILGELNNGWGLITSHLELERVAIAAAYVGNAQTAVNDAARYAKERIQFGRPIGKFQVIKHMLAQMQTDVDAARLMVYRAAYMLSKGKSCSREIAMAKLFGS
ncbi:acyl-CoA dehydrogenase, partial [Aeromonas veronii]|nr:acyl-CoA dehydrogenase [Aeromonas veronii]